MLAFGPPGSGKSHLLCAIGQELIHAERRVLFRRCDLLVQELLTAKRDLYLPRLLKQWGRFDALPRYRPSENRRPGRRCWPGRCRGPCTRATAGLPAVATGLPEVGQGPRV